MPVSVNDFAVKDDKGTIDAAVLPSVSVTNVHVVNLDDDLTALDAEEGDVGIATEEDTADGYGKTYILSTNDPTVLSNWKRIQTPESPVQTVNGKTGAVDLDASDMDSPSTSYSDADSALSAHEDDINNFS